MLEKEIISPDLVEKESDSSVAHELFGPMWDNIDEMDCIFEKNDRACETVEEMMQVSVHMYSSFYLSSLHTFDMNQTFNLYHIVEHDFEHSNVGCFEEEPTLKSQVITSNEALDANDFNDGKSFVKSGVITTNQDSEDLRMSACQNGVNTAHQKGSKQ